jgi:SulP family sulfate permease
MTLSSAPFSELIEYNYSFIPSIGQTWKEMAGHLQARLHLPYLPWWGKRGCAYFKQDVWHDALAGLMCAVLVIPESLSYMVLSSLAPVVGLYTAAVSPFAYALLGTSPHVSVGPISLVALYLPSVFRQLGYVVEDNSEEGKQLRREAASVVAFYVFCLFAVMSFFRLGGLIRFLSHPVMAGFVNASGVFVAFKGEAWSEGREEDGKEGEKTNLTRPPFVAPFLTFPLPPPFLPLPLTLPELEHILDLHLPESTFTHNYQVFVWVLTHLHETQLTSLALGGSALFILLLVKYLKRRFPATDERLSSRPFLVWSYISSFSTLIVVLVGTFVSQALSKRGASLHILGALPSGLSLPSPPPISRYPVGTMLSQALPIAILAYVEAVSIAKKYAAIYNYKLDLNQDLAGYSLANLLSCMWGGVTPSGAFARTAMSAEIGARTSFANFFTGGFVIICLFNIKILYHIPYSVLGALVVSAMMNLISFHEFYHALRIARTSGLVMLFTFMVTLLWSVEDGLLYGIMASLALLLYQLSDVVRMGGNEGSFKEKRGNDDAKTAACQSKDSLISSSLPIPRSSHQKQRTW